MISEVDRQRLLRLARDAAEARVRHQPAPPIERGGVLDDLRSAFVTIHLRGELRGCLGQLGRDEPLALTIAHLAAVVTDSDPRFPPVTADELPGIKIEISVLTPEQDVVDVNDIEVGRHGLIVEHGRHRGLLLPQVATEHGWDRQTFLQQTCVKAGLPLDAWRSGARISSFEAEVFGDHS